MTKQTPEEVTLPATQIASAVQKGKRKPASSSMGERGSRRTA